MSVVGGVECRGFRNLADGRTPVATGVVVVHGSNGAGKTNLLEAIYFGLTGRSFRAGNDRDMIRFGEQGARVELDLSASGSRLLSAIDRSGERRHLLAGRPLAGAPEERPLVSVFHPDRLQLVKGSPAHRRAHLDRLCGAIWPARADLRSRFGRTLAQRNALVQRIRAGLGGADSLPAWDERLAAEAEPLMEARSEAVDALAGTFAELASRPRPGRRRDLLPPSGVRRPRASSPAELARRRAEDLGRAYTSYGPQLDEVELRLGGRALRRFGSQGQQRIALLALLFAERAALIDAGRAAPADAARRRDERARPGAPGLLVSLLESGGQAVITATESDHVPAADAARIEVAGGARQRRARARGRHEPAARSRGPSRRRSAAALERAEPETLLAAVQSAWPAAVGEAIAREATPVTERDGVVTVACCSSTWAQELDLLGGQIIEKIGPKLPSGTPLEGLRFITSAESV